jgi:vitamin B12 transporter
VVVSASRLSTAQQDLGSSVSVITSEDIQKQQADSVYEALRQVPGLSITNKGGAGRQTSVRLRGAEDGHTLVLIDGMEVNDASATSNSFDFGTLSTAGIERIEVVRGPQSGVHGSDAMGGVINIVTKKGEEGLHARAEAEAGSFNTRRGQVSLSGGNGWADINLTASRFMTEGISAADENNGNTENDPHRQTTLQGTVGLNPVPGFRLDGTFRYVDSSTESDTGRPLADADVVSNELQRYGTLSAKLDTLGGRWVHEVKQGVTDIYRDSITSFNVSKFNGQRLSTEYNSRLFFPNNLEMVLGGELETEEAENNDGLDESRRNPSGFVEIRQNAKRYTLAFAGRYDDPEDFDPEATYRATGSYRIPGWGSRLHGSYGTGYKAPTLYQLYAPDIVFPTFTYKVGNPNLESETSRGWDLGIEQAFFEDKVVADVTYFHNRFENLIEYFDNTVGYENVSTARTRGLETSLTVTPLMNLKIRASATWLDAENLDSGEELLSRPDRKAHLRVDYSFASGASVTAQVRHRSEQPDFNGTSDAHTVADLALEVPANDVWTLKGRVENVTDLEYQEVYGYGTRGRSAYVGVSAHY